ncbi:MAG: WYL domain-containing protein [Bacteroidaceae bacterium]|nr:WYL domain-containing protein [Bacteroidaceae bacterium]
MKTPALFREYIWLINTIRKAGQITLDDINERWLESELSEGVEIARSTFNRHRDAILDIFGIIISCNKKNGYKYYIENEEVLRENTVQNWMLSTLSVNNIISESISLQNRILLEPLAHEERYLPVVIEAMKRSVRIAIKYRKYGDVEPKNLNFEPYCLKLFHQRWYVLGHFHRDVKNGPDIDFFGMFSFDRILEMSITDIKFQMNPDFDAEEYFHDCYGAIVNDDTKAQKVVIRVFDFEQYYTKDLMMHHSQHEIGHGEDYTDFELFLRPTIDFTRHLVGLGDRVKVLSPKWLAVEVCNEHLMASDLYEGLIE